MVSVERLLVYGALEPEGVLRGPRDMSDRPTWPEGGGIEARDLVCSYRKGLDPVLCGVSFVISPGQRVGIVGRTGA